MSDTAQFFRPEEGWFGDVMPIVDGDLCHLFYTHLDAADTGSPIRSKKLRWGHLSTADFVHFTEHQTAIPAGTPTEPDLLAGAGSIVGPVDGRYIAFYVGINPHARDHGEPEQVVLRAFSNDLTTFVKDPTWRLVAPAGYHTHAWRDPYVIPHPDGGWRMLLCTQLDQTPARRAGAIGEMRSDDLDTWWPREPLWSPGTTLAPECPETFTLGDDQYLLFSTYSDRFAVRYRRRDGDAWNVPAWDALDSNDFYAATSVEHGGQRLLVGWLATRLGDRDDGKRQWGGDLVVHAITHRDDGTLGMRPLASRLDHYPVTPAQVQPRTGEWRVDGDRAELSLPHPGLAWASLGTFDTQHAPVRVHAAVEIDPEAEETGIAILADDDFTRAYLLRFEPKRGRFVLDRRPHNIEVPFDYGAERGYVSEPDHEIERPLRPGNNHDVTILIEGTCLSIYVDDVALTTRAYDLHDGHIAPYACSGTMAVTGVRC